MTLRGVARILAVEIQDGGLRLSLPQVVLPYRGVRRQPTKGNAEHAPRPFARLTGRARVPRRGVRQHCSWWPACSPAPGGVAVRRGSAELEVSRRTDLELSRPDDRQHDSPAPRQEPLQPSACWRPRGCDAPTSWSTSRVSDGSELNKGTVINLDAGASTDLVTSAGGTFTPSTFTVPTRGSTCPVHGHLLRGRHRHRHHGRAEEDHSIGPGWAERVRSTSLDTLDVHADRATRRWPPASGPTTCNTESDTLACAARGPAPRASALHRRAVVGRCSDTCAPATRRSSSSRPDDVSGTDLYDIAAGNTRPPASCSATRPSARARGSRATRPRCRSRDGRLHRVSPRARPRAS